jgi:threonylcarbamoyladenosine tRNA methylthiotransferase MtaB
VFPYSDRRATEAAGMGDRVDEGTKARRSRRLRDLGRRKNRAFREALVDTVQEVLVLEARDAGGRLVGLTGNYVEVAFAGPERLARTLQAVRITAASDDQTRGEMVA